MWREMAEGYSQPSFDVWIDLLPWIHGQLAREVHSPSGYAVSDQRRGMCLFMFYMKQYMNRSIDVLGKHKRFSQFVRHVVIDGFA